MVRITEDNTNNEKRKCFRFQDLPDKLERFLFDLEQDKVIKIKMDTGLEIRKQEYFFKAISNHLKNHPEHENLLNFIEQKIISGSSYIFFNDLAPIQNTPTSTPKKDSSQDDQKGGSSGGSHPSFVVGKGSSKPLGPFSEDVRVTPLDRIPERIKKRQRDIGVWISKTGLDHVLRWNGKLDLTEPEEGQVFDKLIEGLGIDQFNKTGWAYPIKKADGYCLKVHVHRSEKRLVNQVKKVGTVRVILQQHLDIQLILEHYFKIFHFLDQKEHAILLNTFVDERDPKKSDRLFYTHLANAIGPRQTVDEKLKGGEISIYMRDGAGGKTHVDVIVDYSHGPEIEHQGAMDPSSLVRDLTVDSAKSADTLMGMKYQHKHMIEDNREIIKNQYGFSDELDILSTQTYDNGQTLVQVQQQQMPRQELQAEFSETNARIFGLDIKTDIHHVELKELFKSQIKASLQVSRNTKDINDNLMDVNDNIELVNKSQEELLLTFDKAFQEVKEDLQSREADTLNGLNTVDKNVKKVDENVDKTRKEISKKIEILDKNINKRFDDLEGFIEDKFADFKRKAKDWLYLIFKKLDKVQGLTIKKMQEFTGAPRSSLYYYLKKLREQKLITAEDADPEGPGRPPKLYKFTKKLLKQIKTYIKKKTKKS